jgi:hypothetical protein
MVEKGYYGTKVDDHVYANEKLLVKYDISQNFYSLI